MYQPLRIVVQRAAPRRYTATLQRNGGTICEVVGYDYPTPAEAVESLLEQRFQDRLAAS